MNTSPILTVAAHTSFPLPGNVSRAASGDTSDFHEMLQQMNSETGTNEASTEGTAEDIQNEMPQAEQSALSGSPVSPDSLNRSSPLSQFLVHVAPDSTLPTNKAAENQDPGASIFSSKGKKAKHASLVTKEEDTDTAVNSSTAENVKPVTVGAIAVPVPPPPILSQTTSISGSSPSSESTSAESASNTSGGQRSSGVGLAQFAAGSPDLALASVPMGTSHGPNTSNSILGATPATAAVPSNDTVSSVLQTTAVTAASPTVKTASAPHGTLSTSAISPQAEAALPTPATAPATESNRTANSILPPADQPLPGNEISAAASPTQNATVSATPMTVASSAAPRTSSEKAGAPARSKDKLQQPATAGGAATQPIVSTNGNDVSIANQQGTQPNPQASAASNSIPSLSLPRNLKSSAPNQANARLRSNLQGNHSSVPRDKSDVSVDDHSSVLGIASVASAHISSSQPSVAQATTIPESAQASVQTATTSMAQSSAHSASVALAQTQQNSTSPATQPQPQVQSIPIPDPPRMVDSGHLKVAPNSSELKISVQLPEIGKVEVRAVTAHDVTTAHITASRHEALPALSADRANLEQALKSRDVVLGSLASNAQGQSAGQQQQRQQASPTSAQFSGGTSSTAAAATTSAPAEASTTGYLPDYSSISVRA